MQVIDRMVDSGRSFRCPFCRKSKNDIPAFVYEEEGRKVIDVDFVDVKIVKRRRIVEEAVHEVIIISSSDDEDSDGGSDEWVFGQPRVYVGGVVDLWWMLRNLI